MTDPFLAEIRIVGFNFAPSGWATCDGQLIPISQNTALFSLLGTFYGGDGRSTFALPNLAGSAPMHPGQGPGLTPRDLGEVGGEPNVTLIQGEMPVHNHGVAASQAEGGDRSPAASLPAAEAGGINSYAPPGAPAQMAPTMTGAAGGNLPHNNLQPSLVVTFVIALQGIFPQRP
ncbi:MULTISPECIES: phage tail protein [unclassified Terrabacter]|uniref:phage tail protein n=1 Tax=unclassified Terrabacter TaxID=2630222 RepID=UPI0006F49280|nr:MULTISPECIES: tail fiber protein [unclassified Terrabacter]KRB47098.1 phage tail protein [Terrabacter sp. Root181]KRF38917.1 phage tail protein [Terrabacter sp. Soil810]